MNRSIYILLFLILSRLELESQSQSSIDLVLIDILKNNKTIQAQSQYWEAYNLKFDVALNAEDPKVEFDYLLGSPSNVGNQINFYITQEFDFPSVYKKRKKLRNEQKLLAVQQLRSERQEILWKAKEICIELVYRHKLQTTLSDRKRSTEKWLAHFKLKLEKGDGHILDVHKAQLRWVDMQAAYVENRSAIQQLNQRLTGLNGGILISFTDTVYPQLSSMLAVEDLQAIIAANDPHRMYLDQNIRVGQKELGLVKSLAFPKFEAGYYYESVLGQTFQGVHLGSSIPLWANKNKLKAQQSHLRFLDFNMQEYLNNREAEIAQLIEERMNLQTNLKEYETLFNSLKNMELLEKSMSFGQISSIEYFIEMSFYHELHLNFLKVEMEFYKVDAELHKFLL